MEQTQCNKHYKNISTKRNIPSVCIATTLHSVCTFCWPFSFRVTSALDEGSLSLLAFTHLCSHHTTKHWILPNFIVYLWYCIHILCKPQGQCAFIDVNTHTTNSAKTYTPCWGSTKVLIRATNSILTEADWVSLWDYHIYIYIYTKI